MAERLFRWSFATKNAVLLRVTGHSHAFLNGEARALASYRNMFFFEVSSSAPKGALIFNRQEA
jgi:hypothetical protein